MGWRMSRFIDGLITDIVNDDMLVIKKMKKAEIVKFTETLLQNNYRELLDESIIEEYEERFDTHLARY